MLTIHRHAVRAHLCALCFSTTNGRGALRLVIQGLFGLPGRHYRLWSNFNEQLERLAEVFDCLCMAILKLKPSKCHLCMRKVEFLGHVVSEGQLAMQSNKVDDIRKWPVPRTIWNVRKFMGLAGYYRRFIKGFSIIAGPLYTLMGKDAVFQWMPECQDAFDELKERLTNEPVLALPEDGGTYILDTDASNYGLGAVLSQQQADGEKVITYASRTMMPAEKKYETTRKELLAIVTGLKHFRQYLLGRHIIISTDHAALSWLRRTAEPMPQLARWLTYIEQFDYEVLHRPGVRHGNADALSRRPPTVELDKLGLDEDEEPLSREITDGSDSDKSGLAERQQQDPELGAFVKLRKARRDLPGRDELQAESELTKNWSADGINSRYITISSTGDTGILPGAKETIYNFWCHEPTCKKSLTNVTEVLLEDTPVRERPSTKFKDGFLGSVAN